jgi:hypothetical protein
MPSETRHLSVWIDRLPDDVYEFVSNPVNIPAWAPGLGRGVVNVGGDWYVITDGGRLRVVFAEQNSFGVVDHDVTMPSGEVVHNPMRVVPDGSGSEVTFTLRRQPGMTDEEFERDTGLVGADLDRLKGILEAG